jgi:hypothetical protein
MTRKSILFLLLMAATTGVAAQDSTIPDNRELMQKARSIYVASETIYMKRENLESSLLGRAEFKAWNMQVTNRGDLADLCIRVKRIPFSNHFTYTVTDRRTQTVIMAGKVDSLAGTVYGLIADEIVHKMKAFRGDPSAAKTAVKQ